MGHCVVDRSSKNGKSEASLLMFRVWCILVTYVTSGELNAKEHARGTGNWNDTVLQGLQDSVGKSQFM